MILNVPFAELARIPSARSKENRKMKENYLVCNCKKVSYADIADALHEKPTFNDVLTAFEDVQKVTHCSTGCGGCHQKVLDVISEIMMGTRSDT